MPGVLAIIVSAIALDRSVLLRELRLHIFQTGVILGFVHCIGAFSSDFIAVAVLFFFCGSCECGDTVLAALAFPAVSDCGFDFFKRSENLLALTLLFFLCLSFTFYPLRFIVDFLADSLRSPSASAASCGGTSGAGTQTGASRYQRWHTAPN